MGCIFGPGCLLPTVWLCGGRGLCTSGKLLAHGMSGLVLGPVWVTLDAKLTSQLCRK